MSDAVHPSAAPGGERPGRGWPRAAGLLGVTLATAVVQPSLLIAVPFVALAAVLGMRGTGTFIAAALAMMLLAAGVPGDGVWFLERAWAVLVAGWFAAVTLRRPSASFSSRALASVAGAVGVTSLLLTLRSGAWQTLEWTVQDRMAAGVDTALEAMRVLSGGEALPPALVTAVYETVEAQLAVYPAMLAVASMSGLGVAWWLYRRLAQGDDQGLGALREFTFNDHLVWLFIGGLLLLFSMEREVLVRIGANAVVFMGALYVLRGAGVIMFLSGGFSVFGYVLLALGLVFVPPLVLTGAMVVGIGDTWMDVRARVRDLTA